MRRRLAAAVLVCLPLASPPASGQTFHDAALGLVGLALNGGGWVRVGASVNSREGGCSSSEAALQATAERALRQDGIAIRRDPGVSLWVSVVALPYSVGCATAVKIELDFKVGELFVRGFESFELLVGPRGDAADRLLRSVAVMVSTLANRLRLELDVARQEGR